MNTRAGKNIIFKRFSLCRLFQIKSTLYIEKIPALFDFFGLILHHADMDVNEDTYHERGEFADSPPPDVKGSELLIWRQQFPIAHARRGQKKHPTIADELLEQQIMESHHADEILKKLDKEPWVTQGFPKNFDNTPKHLEPVYVAAGTGALIYYFNEKDMANHLTLEQSLDERHHDKVA